MRATNACMKELEYALPNDSANIKETQSLEKKWLQRKVLG